MSVSNGDWDTKRRGSDGHSGYEVSEVRLTKDLIRVPAWDSPMIDLRSRWLGAAAVRVWSLAPDVKDFPSFSDVAAHPGALHNI